MGTLRPNDRENGLRCSKTTFTDFDKRKKPTTTMKSYKNFSKGNNNKKIGSKKKPPPFAAASSFNAAAAAKRKQIEVSAESARSRVRVFGEEASSGGVFWDRIVKFGFEEGRFFGGGGEERAR